MTNTMLNADAKSAPDIRAMQPAALGEGVIDQSTFDAIEVDELFAALNSSEMVVGQAVLYRSLAQPLDSAEATEAKQDALAWLCLNGALSNCVFAEIE